ncbi:MAG: DUF1800 domain-containing protein, partial [Bacteroidota bacterium]
KRSWTAEKATASLFFAPPLPAMKAPALPDTEAFAAMSGNDRKMLRQEQRKLVAKVNLDWITRMASAESNPLLEKMTLFWHGHFACTSNAGILAIRQLNTLQKHALGNFRDLLKAIARDPAMIRFLNNQQNRKNAPNENFARELMELFTLGRGQYSEQDVKEAARAFTGWSSTLRGDFVFRRFQHDFGTKTFLGKQGDFDGDDVIDIILEQPAVSTFICRKIYAFFVNTEVDTTHVNRLAKTFRTTDYDISAVMQQLFSADWFYAASNVGTRIKSPVELVVGLARQLQASNLPQQGLIGIQRALGQQLFRPPNVAGWPAGRSWIDNSTLVTRLNLARALVAASDFNLRLPQDLEASGRKTLKRLQATLNLAPLRELCARQSPNEVRATLSAYLLATTAPSSLPVVTDADQMALQLLSIPEYQLC